MEIGLVAVPPAIVAVEISCDVGVVAWFEEGKFFADVEGTTEVVEVQEVDVLVVDFDDDF